MHVLVAGCGWLGQAVAAQLVARGDRVTAVRSDPARAEATRAPGIEPLTLDLADPAALERIPLDLDAILALQAPRGGHEAAYRRAYLEANETLLAAARRRPLRALVLTGSTGIFGQRDGSEVEETTVPVLTTIPSLVLAEAEGLMLAAAAEGLPTRIVRLSGLYGPGRLWMLDRMRRGLLALGPGDGAWLNSCHRDDAVATVLAALDRGRPGALYHATDAEPLRRRDLIHHLAARLGVAPACSEAEAAGGPDRRVLGRQTRAELRLELRWPSLREGLEPYLQS